MIMNGRWRGQMPFRQNRRLWPEPLVYQGRTGEPSLATVFHYAMRLREEGHGKAKGSFTERLREELHAWRKDKGHNIWSSPLAFEYRMYRRRTVLVVVRCPQIRHYRLRGDGSKGFVLVGEVLSVDGVLPDRWMRDGVFALTRIVGRFQRELLALKEATYVSGI